MNHKRGRPKNRRSGCLHCKPHKMNGAKQKNKPKVEARLVAWSDATKESCDYIIEPVFTYEVHATN